MLVVIGIVVVFGAVMGGYLMEHGHPAVLFQPAELVIIGGAALGTTLIGNPPHIASSMLKGVLGVFRGSRFTKKLYLESLKMMYDLFSRARKEGLAGLERDVEEPDASPVFSAYPDVMKDHHVKHFICDTIRTATIGAIEPFDIDQMMEADMEVHRHESSQPVASLTTVADALPGLGIVAAVLGVVITMGALGGPPEEIGHKVAAALVGTFLGILLCYGLIGPLAANMAKAGEDEHAYYQVLRVAMTAFVKGSAPILAVEMARRSTPHRVRPSFQELEETCRNRSAAAAAPAAAS